MNGSSALVRWLPSLGLIVGIGLLLPSRAWALVGGVLVQFVALTGYYAASQVRFDAPPGGVGIVAFWAIGGIVGGPVLGLAGVWWRQVEGWRTVVAAALPPALYLSEGLYYLLGLGYSVGSAFLLVGVALAVGLARSRARLLRVLAIALALGMIFYVGFRYGFGFLYDFLTLGPDIPELD